MKLYHGTNQDFGEIDLLKSKPNKDFGRGFYLSPDYAQAIEMAKAKVAQQNTGHVIVYSYELDDAYLKEDTELKVLRFESYSEGWARLILENRNNPSDMPVHDYDLVIGPIADDRFGFQLRRFMDELIDMNMLIHNLQYMKGITFQYFFGTPLAVSKLKRI